MLLIADNFEYLLQLQFLQLQRQWRSWATDVILGQPGFDMSWTLCVAKYRRQMLEIVCFDTPKWFPKLSTDIYMDPACGRPMAF